MSDPPLLQRLKERKMGQWTLAYLAGAWVLYEATGTALEAWDIPLRLVQSIHVLLVFGFFITLILAWYHGEKGRQRVSGPELLMVTALLLVAGVALTMLRSGEEAPEPAEVVESAPAGDDRPGIAVLPCDNMSADPADTYLAPALHDEILLKLHRISTLRSIGRTSVLQYAEDPPAIGEIALALGVEFVGECSVQRHGNQIRLIFQLLDGNTGEQLWAEDYERDLTTGNLFDIENVIVQQIAFQLRAAISPEDLEWLRAVPTHSLEALEAYMQANEAYQREGGGGVTWEHYASIPLYEQAIALDPEFSLAIAGLALAGSHAAPLTEWAADSVLRLARRALAITPDLPEARLALAQSLLDRGEREEALAELRAIEESALHNPDIAFRVANHRRDLGDFDYAIQVYERLVGVNPREPGIQLALSSSYAHAHRFDDALEAQDRRAALLGGRSGGILWNTATIYLARGHRPQANALISQMLQDYPAYFYASGFHGPARVLERLLRPDQRPAAYEAAVATGYLNDEESGLGVFDMSAAMHEEGMGRMEEARIHWSSARAKLERDPPSSDAPPIRVMDHLRDLTLVYLGLGEKELAIATSRRVVEELLGSDCRGTLTSGPAGCTLLARVYAHFGEHDAAIDLLEVLLPAPSRLTVHILEADPIWRPLHGHPRFQALLEEYADDVEHD